MPTILDPQLKRALAARIRYYNELGIYDFYRRETTVQIQPEERGPLPRAKAAILTPAEELIDISTKPESTFSDPAVGLRAIREDQQGEPFVGRAGQLLNNMIKAMGLRREDIYIANIIKCRPPGNRTPERDECETCSPFLMRQIATIKPKVLVALGAVAAKTLLAINAPMSELRGKWYDFRGTKLAVTYHPAFLLRDPRQKKEAWRDLQMVMKDLGLVAPPKSPE
jgi:uracil-DNA glycosylase family 4